MDSDGFFEFDASLPPEDGAVEGGHEDEEYDALNDETFGSAAVVDGDWEESHQQLASITEANRQTSKLQQKEDALLNELQQLGLGGVRGYDGPTSAPISIRRYQGGHHIGSNLMGGPDLPGSPSNSIWTPSPGVDKLQPMGTPPTVSNIPTSKPLGLPSVKTVAELEQEMKMQTARTQPPHPLQQPLRAEDLEKELALRSMSKGPNQNVQSQQWQQFQSVPPGMNQGGMYQWQMQQQQQQQQKQQQQHPQQQQQQHYPQRQPLPLQQQQQQHPHPRFMNSYHGPGAVGGGGGGMSGPNNRGVFNQPRAMQQPNQGGPPHHHPQHPSHHHHHHNQQEGSGPNNFMHGPPHHQHPQSPNQHPQHHHHHQQQQQQHHNNGPPSSHHHQPPHHHHVQQQQQHNNYNNNNQHHHQHHHHNHHHSHHQQQGGYGYHQNNRGQDGNYFNHNGSDSQGRGSYDRWGYDRRSYDQRGGQYERKGWGEDHHGHQHPSRTRRDSEAEWEEWHRCRELDEYSCLMTPREKGWLKYIQAMQLHSDTPYRDDYYFVMYSVKQQRKREEEVVELDGLQLLLPDRGKDGREYEPPRLENSLGKLQVVSVNAPRKIIDLQVVHLDPSHPTTSMQREMRRHRHLLLYIEKLFNTMMELDDLERRIRHLPDCPTRDMFHSKSKTLASRLWTNLNATPDRLLQVLCIRKGKSLLSRLIGWVGEGQQEHLVVTILQNMALLSRKDAHEQQLSLLWPATDRLVATAAPNRLLELAGAFNNNSSSQVTTHKTNLTSGLYNKYGVSLVLAMLVRGEQLHGTLVESNVWQEFLSAIITALATFSSSSANEGAIPKSTVSSSTDANKNEMASALPSVALAASPCRASQHLVRCTGIDPSLLKAAQDRMALLEATHSKVSRSQSPIKS